MSKPYDAGTKFLIEDRFADWLPLCGREITAHVELIDADLSTVTAAADRVLRVHESPSWLFHLELQTSRDPTLPMRMHVYNALLDRRHGLPVRSMAVLVRPEADHPNLSGLWERAVPSEPPYLRFHFDVVRIWQPPPDVFLRGGLGLLPLAPLSDMPESQLPAVVAMMKARVFAEAPADLAAELWTVADLLMGLRYPEGIILQAMQGAKAMEESVTYQAIVRRGMIQGRLEDLLRIGQRRLGSPLAGADRELRSIADPDRLSRMLDRLDEVSSWAELLATP